MHKLLPLVTVVVIVLISEVSSLAGMVPSGYEKLEWNATFPSVYKKYPGGQMARFGDEAVYKQQKPTRSIARRNFGFRNGKLHTVSVTFDRHYVQTKGIEKLLSEQKRNFGDGSMDRSLAPHMIRYVWEGADTKITFAYAPQRPEMTVIMFEEKSYGSVPQP